MVSFCGIRKKGGGGKRDSKSEQKVNQKVVDCRTKPKEGGGQKQTMNLNHWGANMEGLENEKKH